MDEKPKSIWGKSWKGRSSLVIWCALLCITTFLAVLIAALGKLETPLGGDFAAAAFVGIGIVVCGLIAIYVIIPLLRWLFWKYWRRTLFALACLITLTALFYAEEDWRGWHAWNKFKQEWEAKGEHFDYASVVPPPVPDDQNFALAPVIAGSYEMFFDKSGHEVYPRNTNAVDRLSMITWRDNHWAKIPKIDGWQASKKSDLKAWQAYFRSPPPTNSVETNSFPVAPQPQSPADDILLALSKYDSAVEEIRQASQLPYSRFPLTYNKEDPAAIVLPHLNALRSCAQALNLRALAELQNGQSEKAAADMKLSLRLADSIRTEPIVVSHLVRVAMVNLTLQPVYEGLAEHEWSEAQLVELDSELAKLDFLPDYGTAVRGEMGCQEEIINYLRRHPEQFPNLAASGNFIKTPLLARIVWHSIPSGWFYQNQLRCSRFMIQQYLPLADLEHRIVSPASVRRASAAVGLEFRHVSPYNRLEGLLLPAFGAAARKFANAQESVDLARVAIALERYRLARGEYPESLDGLAPQFIAKLPHDIINGLPLHYRRTSDGQFVLYSVGWNETDDGGEVGLRKDGSVNIEKGDWVWRYPQK